MNVVYGAYVILDHQALSAAVFHGGMYGICSPVRPVYVVARNRDGERVLQRTRVIV